MLSDRVRRDDTYAVAALVAVWAALVALVDPRADVPILDDWCYAASVEQILRGLPLRVSPWSSTFPPVHLWWGTLFAWLGGFSFTSLRLATLVLWLAGTVGSYGTLRALGVATGAAFVGAMALALHPVGFVLAFSFMTDAPFVALSWLALWALAAGLRRGREPIVLVGLALAVVAFFVRPVAIMLPAGLFLGALALDRPGLRLRVALYAVATVVAMGGMSAALTRLFPWAGDGGVQYRVMRLAFVFLVPPAVYLEAGLSMLAHTGLALAPLLLAFGPPPRRGAWFAALGLVAAAVVVSQFADAAVSAVKFAHSATFEELGAARPLLQGAPPRDAGRAVASLVATGIGFGAAGLLLERVAPALRAGGWLRRPEWACVAGFGLASFGLCFVLWFFYDRYYLPLVMAGAALALGDATGAVAPWRRVLAAAALAFVALADVTGTRDMLAYARAVGATAAELRAEGVSETALDAGYVENGWRLYAHPERLPAGKIPELDVPHVTAKADGLPWVIANAPLAGYHVLRTVAVPTWWAYTDRLYVLRAD